MTIFGEEHFFDKSMISIIEERGNVIDNFIYDEIAGVAKYELPMPKIIINKEKVKKWLILCGQLENLEHSELVDMATKKKFADKDNEIQELKELLNMERSIRKIEAQKLDKEIHNKERYKARVEQLQSQLGIADSEAITLKQELKENFRINKLFIKLYKEILNNSSIERFQEILEKYRAEVKVDIAKALKEKLKYKSIPIKKDEKSHQWLEFYSKTDIEDVIDDLIKEDKHE